MRRCLSRAVAVLCVVYLVALLLFHHQLGPFNDRHHPASDDYVDERETLSVTHLVDNSSNARAQGSRIVKHQLLELEAGMTELEKQISIVKSELSRRLSARSVRHQDVEQQRRQDVDLQQRPERSLQRQGEHQQRVSIDHLQQRQNQVHMLDLHPLPHKERAQTVRRLRHQQQDRLPHQPSNIRLPTAFPLQPQGILGMPLDAGHEEGGADPPVEDYTNSSLVKIGEGVAVYAAYHDDRLPGRTTVRLIVILSAPKPSRRVLCHFHSPNLMSAVEAEQYELCENHKKKYLGFIYSCRVPEELKRAHYKLFLSPIQNPDSRVTLPVTYLTPPDVRNGKVSEERYQYRYNFSVCVSPLFGSVLAKRLVEFMELTRLLGVQQVFFYDFQLSSVVQRVLSFYQDKGWVTLLPWRLPPSMNNARIWYHGQLVSNNDCLYRTMAVSAYTAFHDIDEFIVPHAPEIRTLSELFPPVLPNDTCGYSFSSAFYDPGITNNNSPDDLMTVSLTAKSAVLSKIRTKVLVAPRRVFEVGIHHISKQFREHWSPRRYDSTRAILHHYRECIRDYGMRCENWVKDTIIKDKYMPELKHRVWAVIRTLSL